MLHDCTKAGAGRTSLILITQQVRKRKEEIIIGNKKQISLQKLKANF
jgi:hypothetical protein